MDRLTKRCNVGLCGSNDKVILFPLCKVAQNNEYKDRGLIQQCFERLAWYEDLEEQGLLPALHIGEDIYFRANGRNQFGEYVDFIQTQKITKIDIDLTGVLYCTASVKFILSDIGRTVFLSRKEAEQVVYKL